LFLKQGAENHFKANLQIGKNKGDYGKRILQNHFWEGADLRHLKKVGDHLTRGPDPELPSGRKETLVRAGIMQ